MSSGVGRRHSDPVLLWLWRRPAAVALIRPLAWEPPYAKSAALERKKKKKKKKERKKKEINLKKCNERCTASRNVLSDI